MYEIISNLSNSMFYITNYTTVLKEHYVKSLTTKVYNAEHELNHHHGCPTLPANVSPHIAIESSYSHAKQTSIAQSTRTHIKLRGMQ